MSRSTGAASLGASSGSYKWVAVGIFWWVYFLNQADRHGDDAARRRKSGHLDTESGDWQRSRG